MGGKKDEGQERLFSRRRNDSWVTHTFPQRSFGWIRGSWRRSECAHLRKRAAASENRELAVVTEDKQLFGFKIATTEDGSVGKRRDLRRADISMGFPTMFPLCVLWAAVTVACGLKRTVHRHVGTSCPPAGNMTSNLLTYVLLLSVLYPWWAAALSLTCHAQKNHTIEDMC